MNWLFEFAPWLAAMTALIACSAFFSSSEAALFYLRRQDRRTLQTGNSAQRIAAGLLDDPDRLLTAVLFWNLVTNITYFAIVSMISIRLEGEGLQKEAVGITLGSLLVIIFFSEMLPKSAAVLQSRWVATTVAIPLAASVRVLDPVIALFRFVNLLSRRLLFPTLTPESGLDLNDLERAIEHSTQDVSLVEQERAVLQNIVSLSHARVDEVMRPRVQFRAFRPPVSLSDLEGNLTPSGYLLVTEPDSDEIAGAIPLKYLSEIPTEHLEYHSESVIYIPWSASAAEALEAMRRAERDVAAVVNEYGETIGIVSFDDLLDTIFGQESSRSARMLQKSSIVEVGPDRWHVTGITNLRRLANYFDVDPPKTKSVSVGGYLQESLQTLPEKGDVCRWGAYQLEVLELLERGEMSVQITQAERRANPKGERGTR